MKNIMSDFVQGELFEDYIGIIDENGISLKPCPFCGGKGELKESMGDFSVRCIDCDCGTPWFMMIDAGRDKAISTWNKRHCACRNRGNH
jgi:hypothetical protein